MERSARGAFFRLLPGILCPVFLPLQREAGRFRLRDLLGENRRLDARAGAAVSLCAGISRAVRSRRAVFFEAGAGLRASVGAAALPRQHGAECVGFCSLARLARFVRQDRAELPRHLLPCGGDRLLQEFSGSALRSSTPAIEVADRRYAGRQPAVRSSLHRAVRYRCGAAVVDKVLGTQPGADPLVLRLRHHPLPADGRGHHLQARLGVYRRHRGHRLGLFRAGRVDRRNFPRPNRRVRSAA